MGKGTSWHSLEVVKLLLPSLVEGRDESGGCVVLTQSEAFPGLVEKLLRLDECHPRSQGCRLGCPHGGHVARAARVPRRTLSQEGRSLFWLAACQQLCRVALLTMEVQHLS